MLSLHWNRKFLAKAFIVTISLFCCYLVIFYANRVMVVVPDDTLANSKMAYRKWKKRTFATTIFTNSSTITTTTTITKKLLTKDPYGLLSFNDVDV